MSVLAGLVLVACAQAGGGESGPTRAAPEVTAGQRQALFASGCFWCTEKDFEGLPGVLSVESGYIGGAITAPSYAQVSRGGTGHAEAVRVVVLPGTAGSGGRKGGRSWESGCMWMRRHAGMPVR